MAETPSIQLPPHSVEDFRGDFDELAILMQESWAENPSRIA